MRAWPRLTSSCSVRAASALATSVSASRGRRRVSRRRRWRCSRGRSGCIGSRERRGLASARDRRPLPRARIGQSADRAVRGGAPPWPLVLRAGRGLRFETDIRAGAGDLPASVGGQRAPEWALAYAAAGLTGGGGAGRDAVQIITCLAPAIMPALRRPAWPGVLGHTRNAPTRRTEIIPTPQPAHRPARQRIVPDAFIAAAGP
jgi:hypothetical protein